MVHLLLADTGRGGLGCLIHDLTGIPCPGCGLTTASIQFLRGDWNGAFAIHPFAPLFLLTTALLAVSAVLPREKRERLEAWLAGKEARHGHVLGLAATSLVLHWIFRLLYP